jgi:hypothetical protein
MRKEVTEGWKKLHKNGLHNFFSSVNVIRVIKAMSMGGTVHVTCMRKMRNACIVLLTYQKGRDQVRNGKITCEWILDN